MPTFAAALGRIGHRWWRSPLRRLLASSAGARSLRRLSGDRRRWLDELAAPRELSSALSSCTGRSAVLVTHELSPSGAPRVLADIAKGLLADGWQVAVVSAKDGVFRAELVAAGAAVVVSESALQAHSPAVGLAQYADLVICNTIVTGVVAALCMRAAPTIIYAHETSLVARIATDSRETANALAGAAQVWAASDIVADAVRPFRRDVSVVYPAGLDSGYHPRPTPGETLRLGVFGSIEARKGQDALVDALDMLEPSHAIAVRFWGETRDVAFAQRFTNRIAADPRFHYSGVVRPEEVQSLMREQDLVVVPSREEPFSLVALEALATGIPVMVTQACGVSRVLTDGMTAFIAEEATPSGIAAALQHAINEVPRWPEIAANGRALFERSFTAAAFQERIRTRIAEALDQPVKRPLN